MMNNFEKGKETERAIKEYMGLPAIVSKRGEIDAVLYGYNVEIKRGACALYVGKRFNRYRNAANVVNILAIEAFHAVDNENSKAAPMLRSNRVAYSIDGTIENTYIVGTHRFLWAAASCSTLYHVGKGKKELQLQPSADFIQYIKDTSKTLVQWKAEQEAKAAK